MPRQPFSPSYHHASPSSSAVYVDSIDPAQLSMPAVEQTSPSTSSRLKLILPPLKGGKPIKGQKKKGQEKVKGPPRPTKLKPLKEVLARLISQIKKKDEYGFFLKAVNASQVPGYADVIKRPMDLGTMSTKVTRGKYRSLEDFASDLRLVTTNAKTFNPLGSIYYTEADRIEAWALEQITKAATTVIEFETDWNIEVEGDEEEQEVAVDDDGGTSTGRGTPAVDGAIDDALPAMAPSGRRVVPRFPVQKVESSPSKDAPKESVIKATLDPEGHLPGFSEGVGQFPPGSDWAPVMLALKLKDKRYRTKKERLRIEKEGLPHAPDGSLEYLEIQNPFSVLSALLPDPLTRPQLKPLYPVPSMADPSQTPLPAPTALYFPPPPALSSRASATSFAAAPSLSSAPSTNASAPSTSAASELTKRKYFTITRTAPTRGAAAAAAAKREETAEPAVDATDGNGARPAHALDFGGYAFLLGALARAGGVPGAHAAAALGTEERLRAYIRAGLEADAHTLAHGDADVRAKGYWTDQRAREAGEYLRDVVYGGTDGLAYTRSVAEFIGSPPLIYRDSPSARPTGAAPGSNGGKEYPLGEPLVEYVQRTVLDPITGNRLRTLQAAAQALKDPGWASAGGAPPELRRQIEASSLLHPHLALMLHAIRRIGAQPADVADLVGPVKKRKRLDNGDDGAEKGTNVKRTRNDTVKEGGAMSIGEGIKTKVEEEDVEMGRPQEEEEEEASDSDIGQSGEPEDPDAGFDLRNQAALAQALSFAADTLIEIEKKRKAEAKDGGPRVKVEDERSGGAVKGATIRKLRLCLLALARAAPPDALLNVPPSDVRSSAA